MKKYVINGRFLIHRVTGVERYAREILRGLDELSEKGEFELAVPPEVKELPDLENISVVSVGKLHNILWEHISFPLYVKKRRGTSLNLCNVAPLPDPGMVCVFDMKIRDHPEFFSWKFVAWYRLLFANIFSRARCVFTDSHSAKEDILRWYGYDRDRIIVTPCSWEHYERVGFDEQILLKCGLEKGSYFFAIGSLDPNKNFAWIAETAQRNPQETFAVAGAINKAVFSDRLGLACPGNMKLLGYVSDEEAKTLMRDCKAFLFPSFCEGFGMPPLEAMSAGSDAIIVSDIPVMHELFEDVVAYLDPNNPDAQLSYKQITDKNRKRILNKYSWKDSARIVLETCRTIK